MNVERMEVQMKIGVFTMLYNDRDLENCLAKFSEAGIRAIELYTGPLGRCNHIDLDGILSGAVSFKEYKKRIEGYGLTISAINSGGNPVHPIKEIAAAHHQAFEKTVRVAELLEVEVVAGFSGCPGGSPGDVSPNWVCCPWPEEYSQMLAYQWDEVLAPYWNGAADFAEAHGVKKIALEMHPGFSVYNPETLMKLRALTGGRIGANLDPSHLIWQGIDLYEAILYLGDAIYHMHAKDTFVNDRVVRVTGNIDAKHYADPAKRAWSFCTVGNGLDEAGWRSMMTALAYVGYDYVLSIEHEDMLMSRDEGFLKAAEFLKRLVIEGKPDGMWWA